MEEFGMVRDVKERELVRNLYRMIEGRVLRISNEVFKEYMLLILCIGTGRNTYSESEIQRRFKVFRANKMSITPRVNKGEKKIVLIEEPKEQQKETEKSSEEVVNNILSTINKFKSNKQLFIKSMNMHNKGKNDKCILLYNLSKIPKKYKAKGEQDNDELTFTPLIQRQVFLIRSRYKEVQGVSTFNTKGVESSVERIRKGREVYDHNLVE
jgi:hypothetical protein